MFCLCSSSCQEEADGEAEADTFNKEEEASLSASNTLVITATIAMIVCSILEVALYRLYNRKVD